MIRSAFALSAAALVLMACSGGDGAAGETQAEDLRADQKSQCLRLQLSTLEGLADDFEAVMHSLSVPNIGGVTRQYGVDLLTLRDAEFGDRFKESNGSPTTVGVWGGKYKDQTTADRGFATAKALYKAMDSTRESTQMQGNDRVTTRNSPQGRISCQELATMERDYYSCKFTGVIGAAGKSICVDTTYSQSNNACAGLSLNVADGMTEDFQRATGSNSVTGAVAGVTAGYGVDMLTLRDAEVGKRYAVAGSRVEFNAQVFGGRVTDEDGDIKDPTEPDQGYVAAKRIYDAMTQVQETQDSQTGLTTRKSPGGRISCTRSTTTSKENYKCEFTRVLGGTALDFSCK